MRSFNLVATSASMTLLASAVSAHVHGPRSGGTPTIARRATTATDWQAEASITVTATECAAYYIAEVNSLASIYPSIWTIASIPSADTYASSIFSAMETGIPDIATKGTPTGDVSGVDYNDSEDPDCWWTATGCDVPKHSGIPPDVTACAEPKTWGLTFDDGPNCTHNAFYDFLAQKNQKATMCYIGSNVIDWPLQAQRGIADGHHIIGHTWSHMYMTSLTNEEVFAELYYTSKIIKDIMGISVDAWRPPYGDIDDRVRYIATQLGLKSILWSADTDDWEVQPAGTETVAQIEALYSQIIGNVSSTTGNIVLTHEINQYTMDLFMDEYSKIQAAFEHIMPLTACMNWTNPYQEDVTYPDFAAYASGTTTPSGNPTSFSINSASYSIYMGGGSSVVVNEGVATAASTATSSSKSGKNSSSGSGSSSSSTSSSSGSTSTFSANAFVKSVFGVAVAAAIGGVMIFV